MKTKLIKEKVDTEGNLEGSHFYNGNPVKTRKQELALMASKQQNALIDNLQSIATKMLHSGPGQYLKLLNSNKQSLSLL